MLRDTGYREHRRFDATVDPPLADDVDAPPGAVCYAIETDDTFGYSSPVVTATVS